MNSRLRNYALVSPLGFGADDVQGRNEVWMTHSTSRSTRNRRIFFRFAGGFALLVAMAFLMMGTPGSPQTASAQTPPAVVQCDGNGNGGGSTMNCTVTVVNNQNGGIVSSSFTVARTCTSPLGTACGNTPPTTTNSTSLVTSVDQCYGSDNGGGSTVTCSVTITNDITSSTAVATPATIDQCNGSGTGGGTQPTTNCTPLGSTSGATITQCNGSGNGGGASMRVTCTVGPGSTTTSALPITVNQCNDSSNGGGSLVTCTTMITNNIITPDSPAAGPAPAAPPAPAAAVATPTAIPTVIGVPAVIAPAVVLPGGFGSLPVSTGFGTPIDVPPVAVVVVPAVVVPPVAVPPATVGAPVIVGAPNTAPGPSLTGSAGLLDEAGPGHDGLAVGGLALAIGAVMGSALYKRRFR